MDDGRLLRRSVTLALDGAVGGYCRWFVSAATAASMAPNPTEPVPLRVQLVRSVLLHPVVENPGAFTMRAANVERDGKALSCLLLSYSLPPNPAPRSWVEREDCIDPATGLLQMWSEAPGIYALYDYNGAANFHGHTLPRQISIFEDGRLAVQVRVESVVDAPGIDPSLFQPTPEMVAAGESFNLSTPRRFPMRVDPSDAPTSPFFQPVIVHAISRRARRQRARRRGAPEFRSRLEPRRHRSGQEQLI